MYGCWSGEGCIKRKSTLWCWGSTSSLSFKLSSEVAAFSLMRFARLHFDSLTRLQNLPAAPFLVFSQLIQLFPLSSWLSPSSFHVVAKTSSFIVAWITSPSSCSLWSDLFFPSFSKKIVGLSVTFVFLTSIVSLLVRIYVTNSEFIYLSIFSSYKRLLNMS